MSLEKNSVFSVVQCRNKEAKEIFFSVVKVKKQRNIIFSAIYNTTEFNHMQPLLIQV